MISYWDMLGDDERGSWLELAKDNAYEPGDRLCIQGKQAAFVAVIYFGWVKITTGLPDGHEAAIALRYVGDLIGESASAGRTCTASVIAIVGVRAWRITAEQFAEFLRRYPRAESALQRTYGDRRMEAERRGIDLTHANSDRRLARFLVELAERCRRIPEDEREVTLEIPLSDKVLGELIYVAPRTVQRALKDWRRRGLITRDRRGLTLHDVPALRRIARPESSNS